ncbi:hypothetical protein C0J52_06084 [Blattella germanica]|nr:hypothetical protein C0J52_06084 [Blattella germanica]
MNMSNFKQEKQLWLNHLLSGELENVFQEIQERLKGDEDGKLSFSLMATLANALSTGKLPDGRSDDVFRLSRLCFEAINVSRLTDAEKFKFVCSLAHVQKYLIGQKNVESALQISCFIVPVTCTADDTDTCKVLYSIYYMFYHLIFNEQFNLSDKLELLKLFSICKQSLMFLGCCVEKYLKIILDSSARFLRRITLTKTETSQLLELVFYILDMISRGKNEKIEMNHIELYESYVSFLFETLKCLIKVECLEEAKVVIEKTLKTIHFWFKHNTIPVIKGCTSLLSTVLHIFMDQPRNFSQNLPSCTLQLKNLVLRYGNDPFISWTTITIAWMIQFISLDWFTLECEKWKEVLLTSNCVKCTSLTGEVCPVENDTCSSISVLVIIINCASLSIQYGLPGNSMLLCDAHSALNDAISHLTKLKSANCSAWKDLWTRLAIKIYNLGVHCKSAGLVAEAKEFYSQFCWTCLQFDKQPEGFPGEGDLLSKGLILLSQSLKELKKFRSALGIIALAFITTPNAKSKLLQQWTRLKSCCLLNKSTNIHAQALLLHVPVVWVSGSSTKISDVIPSLKSLIEVFKKGTNDVEIDEQEKLCTLGNLQFWLFMCEHKMTGTRQEMEIQQSNIIPTKCNSQDDDNPDPLEKCDVIPAYKNLNIENESALLNILDEALVSWCNAMIKTWNLYYQYAKKAGNIEGMLHGICQLLEWCSCGEADCKWLAKACAHLEELKLKEKEDFNSQLLYHKYIFAHATHCFRNKQFTEITDLLEQLSEFTKVDKIRHFSQSILHVKVGALVSKCKFLPPPYCVTCPSRYSKHPLAEALHTLCVSKSLIKQNKISLWLGQLYLEMFWPREARCYLKANLLLSQKLGLVTRSLEFLTLLALVDVMCCNKNDCQVKLHGMEALLQLDTRSQGDKIVVKEPKLEKDVEIVSLLEQLNLEEYQMRENSSERFNWSPLNSPNLCKAEVYRLNSVLKESAEFFEGSLKVYHKLLHKQEKIIKRLNGEINRTLLGKDDSSKCCHLQSVLIPLKIGFIKLTAGYADFMALGKLFKQASKLNKKACEEIKSLMLYYPQIYADIQDQKCSIDGMLVSPAASLEGETLLKKNISECVISKVHIQNEFINTINKRRK